MLQNIDIEVFLAGGYSIFLILVAFSLEMVARSLIADRSGCGCGLHTSANTIFGSVQPESS